MTSIYDWMEYGKARLDAQKAAKSSIERVKEMLKDWDWDKEEDSPEYIAESDERANQIASQKTSQTETSNEELSKLTDSLLTYLD